MNARAFDRDEKQAMAEQRPSASVRGAGELSGGDYRKVLILGAGEVTGDIRAERLRVFGAGELHGSADIDSLRVFGSGSVSGDVVSGRVKAMGSLDIGGGLKAQSFSVVGACDVEGRVLADELSILGAFDADGVEAGAFRARGVLEVNGLLAGDTVELHIGGGQSRVDEIGGGRVEVWRHSFGKRNPLIKALGWLSNPSVKAFLRASVIEADDVSLENTRAKIVRGKRVRIGFGCTIDEVEYVESLTVHPKARVGKRTKR